MATPTEKKIDSHLGRDLAKLGVMLLVVTSATAIFVITPALSTPAFLSILLTLLFSPIVKAMERQGYSRTQSIIVLFAVAGTLLALSSVWVAGQLDTQWLSFKEKAPAYFDQTVERLERWEENLKKKVGFFEEISLTQRLIDASVSSGQWFIKNAPVLVGDLLSWFFIVPILTFFLIKDGRTIRRSFFSLVPNRYFESTFMVTSRILSGISDYIRAKAIEGLLVGTITSIGMFMIDAPFPLLLGVIAGVTNIVPYLGPFLGAAPGVFIAALDPAHTELLWPIVLIYIIANVIDLFFIFPYLVAKIVDLHPLILIIAVILGGSLYGFAGVLISIPIVAALKVILFEIYLALYRPVRR